MRGQTSASETHRAIDAVWRIESARLIAGLARMVRDIGVAEELAQDALVAALEQWPESGVPENPGAWLMATAKYRALDLLRLMFTACHPVLSREARVALTLQLLGGLATDEIARAFLVPEATVAQRIVRAKRTLAAARVSFEVPRGAERAARLASVLEVVYLVFNEGYSATAGDSWTRPALCDDALRLGRVLAEFAPAEPEAHGRGDRLGAHRGTLRPARQTRPPGRGAGRVRARGSVSRVIARSGMSRTARRLTAPPPRPGRAAPPLAFGRSGTGSRTAAPRGRGSSGSAARCAGGR